MFKSWFIFWLVVGYTCVAGLWTTEQVAERDSGPNSVWHHYEYLVDGFLAGHTYLSLEPSKELLALKDPTDPVQNHKYRLLDASLYKGKYYLYCGPTPALILMLPYKVLTGHMMPQRVAIGLFGCFGLLALATITLYLRKTYFPDISWGWTTFVYFVIAHACWMPVLLRRPGFWELPIASALALAWWGLFCLFKALQPKVNVAWALTAGLCFGLVLGCRPTYLFGVTFAAGYYVWVKRTSFKSIGLFLFPIATCGISLLIYNYARFGSVTEFGQNYQLWGFHGTNVHFFSLTYLPLKTWLYLFSNPTWSLYFPFVRSMNTFVAPGQLLDIEAMYGVVVALPVLLLGCLAIPTCFWKSPSGSGLMIPFVFSATLALILFCYAGASSRYIAELLTGWIVLTIFGLFMALRARYYGTVCLLSFWSIVFSLLASAEHTDFFKLTSPKFYHSLAYYFDMPSQWYLEKVNPPFGVYALTLELPQINSDRSGLIMFAGQEDINQIVLHRHNEHLASVQFIENGQLCFETKPFHTDKTTKLLINAPWFYPPTDHPYWDGIKDPIRKKKLQTLFMVEAGGITQVVSSSFFFDSISVMPNVIRAKNSTGWVTQVEVLPMTIIP